MEEVFAGFVKFFNVEKGFGFIMREDGGEIFFHVTSIDKSAGELAKGDRVEFTEREGRGGKMAAVNVTRI